MILRPVLLHASRNRWLAERVPRYRFARATARRFIPGEDLDAALAASADLSAAGVSTMLTQLGEDVTSLAVATRARDHYRVALDRIAAASLPACISVKLTHLGIELGDAHAVRLLTDLAAHAGKIGNVVWVDMEGSELTQRTLDIFRTVLAQHRNIGICLQAYLHRAERDLEALTAETTAIRLVKGAYSEPPTIARRRKHDIDAAYHRLALRLLDAHRDREDERARNPAPRGAEADAAPRPALATHDVPLAKRIIREAKLRGVRATGFEVQMLYGIRTADQRALAADAEGPSVRVLVSYGADWFAWFVRRLAERPANIAFLVRNVLSMNAKG